MESIDEPPSYALLLAIFTPEAWFFLLSGITLALLLILSAIISGSEVAFFSLTSRDITDCKERGSMADQKLLLLIQNPKLLLATILIVNNFVNVAFVTLSTFVMWEYTGSQSAEGRVIIILTTVVTLALVFFGEVLPKVYATANNIVLARFTAPLLKLAETVFKPVSFLLMSFSNIIEKRFQRKGYDISVEELHHALEITTKNEDTTDEEKDILKGIVNFGTLTVKQVMRSRMDITAFEDKLNFHELMDKINKSGFSRIPVYTETIDNIKGVLYIKDLLSHIEKDEFFEWQQFLRPGFFVPETKKIDALLKDFQEKRVHIAIVVDEYGGTSGLITLEDIIEEIVGEINDEFDEEDIIYSQVDEHTFLFEGKTTLNDFCKVVEENPSIFEKIKGESESLGGLLLEINGKLPNAGERMSFDKYLFTVVAVDNRRIKRVRVFIQEETEK